MADDVLSSPSAKTRKALSMATEIPLDSPSRQRPIHTDLPEVKVPSSDLPISQYHPVTCEPFTAEDLQYHKFQNLQKQYSTPEAARKAQEEAIREVKQKMAESAQKTSEIDKQIMEKEQMRVMERKIYENMVRNKGANGRG